MLVLDGKANRPKRDKKNGKVWCLLVMRKCLCKNVQNDNSLCIYYLITLNTLFFIGHVRLYNVSCMTRQGISFGWISEQYTKHDKK